MNFAFSWIVSALLCHRIFIVTLPFFASSLNTTKGLILNVGIGLLSDLSLLWLLYLMFSAFADFKKLASKKVNVLSILFALIFAFALGSHVSYVEHFGTTLRFFHLQALFKSDLIFVGPSMVLSSARSVFMLLASFVLSILVYFFCMR